MDPSYRSPPRKGGDDEAVGSVRRARERVTAGLPAERPTVPAQAQAQAQPQPQSRGPFRDPRAAPSPPQTRSKVPVSTNRGPQNIGMAISRPSPAAPQWPLAGPIQAPQYAAPTNRGPAPQRPPRPRNVPSMLDSSKIQDHTPAFQYQVQQAAASYSDDELMSPDLSGSRPLTTSSVGTIPDFPVPNNAMLPPRRSANLGPPPSSRRGASSYYSQTSYVSPIPEESPRSQQSGGNHGSYASSSAMPTSWGGEDSPGYEEEDRIPDTIEEGRESRESNFSDHNDGEERGLVRSVSIGRRAKPSMVTTKSSEKVDEATKNAQAQSKGTVAAKGTTAVPVSNKLAKMGFFGAAEMKDAKSRPANTVPQRDTLWPMVGDLDSSSASSESSKHTASSETVPTLARNNIDARFGLTNSPLGRASPTLDANADPRQSIMAAHLAASSIVLGSGAASEAKDNDKSWSRLSAIRRPPKLDINAVRDAEARGSLTSLPDLIRRATRLAAMMDKGKRPGSRLDDLNGFGDELAKEKEMGHNAENRQSGLSGMLAAFPPPGLATPTRDVNSRNNTPTGRRESRWPSQYDEKDIDGVVRPRGTDAKPRRVARRCCGIKVWVVVLLLFILAIIVTAGVVIPLKILVLDKSTATTSSAMATCQNDIVCANSGTNTLSSGVCSCICVNGFMGTDCSVAGNSSCTTTSFTSGSTPYNNVTLGNAIPRLVSQGQANFSIPLFTETILAKFNAAGLSCDAQNALVTFDGYSIRYGNAENPVVDSNSAPTTAITTGRTPRPSADARRAKGRNLGTLLVAKDLEPRGSEGNVLGRQAGSVTTITSISTEHLTTSGLSHDSTTTVLSTRTTNPSATNSAALGARGSSPPFVATQVDLDLARIVVLFILQQESLANAETAESAIQSFLDSNSAETVAVAANLSLGNGNTMNFIYGTVNIGHGDVGGVNVSSVAPSSTAAPKSMK